VVVFQQVEDTLAVWVVCAADYVSKNRHYPMHCPFVQVKGIGDEEGNCHHHPLLEE
jgi:hypothetical protein